MSYQNRSNQNLGLKSGDPTVLQKWNTTGIDRYAKNGEKCSPGWWAGTTCQMEELHCSNASCTSAFAGLSDHFLYEATCPSCRCFSFFLLDLIFHLVLVPVTWNTACCPWWKSFSFSCLKDTSISSLFLKSSLTGNTKWWVLNDCYP